MPIKPPHTSTPPATRPLVGAALLALALAGCGGSSSGDSGGAGASDAGAITPKTNGSHASSGGDAAAAGSQNAAQNGNAASSGDSSSDAASKPTSGATPVTDAGISTELFEQMLSTQTAYVMVGPHAIPISAGYAAEQLRGWDPNTQTVDRNDWGDPGNPNSRADILSYQYTGGDRFFQTVRDYDSTGKRTEEQHHLYSESSFGVVFAKEGESRDQRLTIKTDATIKYGTKPGSHELTETDNLTAPADKVIPRDGVVPFDQPVQEWTGPDEAGPDGHQWGPAWMKLTVEKGDASDEVQLCLYSYSLKKAREGNNVPPNPRGDLQRKVCSEWQVANDWTSSQRLTYRGIFVEEDNTTADIPNQENSWYFRTRPEPAGRDATTGSNGGAAAGGSSTETVTQALTNPPAVATEGARIAQTQGAGALSVSTASGAALVASRQSSAGGDASGQSGAGTGGDAAQQSGAAATPSTGGAASGTDTAKPDAAAQQGSAAQGGAAQTTPAADATAKPDAAAQTAPATDAAAKPDAAAPAADATTPAPADGAAAKPDAAPQPAPAADAAQPAGDAATAPATGNAAPAPAADATPATGDAAANPAPAAPATGNASAGNGNAGADAAVPADEPQSSSLPASSAHHTDASTSANDNPPDSDPIGALVK